ncbi:MAG TPA: M14 family zinc carboxypeptidase, partial [Rubricoccaceae bacterium]|nr:M14 family zinc carboxypeptidase [Rubricoccaceae bacterium]
RMFFIPMVNPDGYRYNYQTNPSGGGMWRKNRRNNGGGEFGVDPNRNYAYQWGRDEEGSSSSTWSEVYRGPAPFSEPETQAVRDFLESGRRVELAFNYHTSGDLLLYSWSYEDGAYTPDDSLFDAYGAQLTSLNGYTYGTSPDVLYKVNGGSDDWMYGEQTTKPKILAFTPEVGHFGFWPPASQIIPQADENLEMNLWLAQLAGRSSTAQESPEMPPGTFALAPATPNPFRGGTRLAFTLPAGGAVELAVYDVLGRRVAVLADGPHAAGRHVVAFEAGALPAGVYVARLTTGGQTVSRPLTIVR